MRSDAAMQTPPGSVTQAAKGGRLPQLLSYALAAAFIAAAVYLFATCRIVPVNADGGFYLSIARDLLNGATPTIDVSTTYTPGVFYIMASVMKLFGDRYSALLFFVYLVQAANTVMLYAILSRTVAKRSLAFMACLSYYYSHLLLEGWYFELEPFQIFFILFAVIILSSAAKMSYRLPFVGLCLGCSIMCKQYSALALIAVCLVTWISVRRSGSAGSAIAAVLSIALCASLPFLAFVALSRATFVGSLYSFGFLGTKATSYAAQGMTEPLVTLKDFLIRIVHMNWLYVPVAAAGLVLFRGIRLHLNPLFPLLFGLFILPEFVKQHGHYYQLIAPWAFIIGASVVDGVMKSDGDHGRFQRGMIIPASLISFAILPLFLVFSPSFYAAPAPHALIARITLLFLFCSASVVVGSLYASRVRLNTGSLVLIVMALLFFETLFLSLKLPFGIYAEQKAGQAREAAALNRVFPRGSKVFVVDYPQLCFTCEFVSPTGYYGFPLTEKKAEEMDWTRIDKLVLGDSPPFLSSAILSARGYRRLRLPPAVSPAVYVRKDGKDGAGPVLANHSDFGG
jgi:hypothetical protein